MRLSVKYRAWCNILLIVIAALLFGGNVMAQNQALQKRKIEGTVSDSQGVPIVGATVMVKGNSTKGTATNIDGSFQLELTDQEREISVSYLGYATQEIDVAKGANFKITLKDDSTDLEEVVVVAYGTVLKSDLSGSISVLDVDDKISEQPIANISQFMQGRVSGVQIQQNSGAPGSGMTVQIRGAATITGSTTPLYVVDGVPTDDIEMINPNDVESMQVLKDASSTAIYGSRGTNGVIIITTKQAQKGKTRVNYSYRMDLSNVAKRYNLLNAYDYALYRNELARTSSGFDSAGNLLGPEGAPIYNEYDLAYFKENSTDWQDLLYQTGISHSHQINLTGGNDKSNYVISGFYDSQEGIIMNTSNDKYGVRFNHNWQLNDRFKLNTRINYADNVTDMVSHSDNNSMSTVVSKILSSKPTVNPFDLLFESENEDEYTGLEDAGLDNPYKIVQEKADERRKRFLTTNLSLNYNLAKGIDFTLNGNYNSVIATRRIYYSTDTSTGNNTNGQAQHINNWNDNYLFEALFKYNRVLNQKHRVNVVAGWTYENKWAEAQSITATDFINDALGSVSLGSAMNISAKSSSITTRKLSSFLSRVNYTYDNKYIATATGRYDGSSLLAEGNRWAFFPSGAFAWRVSQEDWMKGQRVISDLKLKTSVGLTGNQNIGYGAPEATLGIDQTSMGGDVVQVVVPNAIANPDLTWETTLQTNAGVELSLLKNTVRFNVDLYNRTTKNMLINYKLAPSTGYGSTSANIGSIRNKGVDIELSGDIFKKSEFKWTLGGNITFDRNVVVDLAGAELEGNTYLSGGGILNQSIHITKEGYPVGSFYGYVIDGIYQNEAEVALAPNDTTSPATPGSYKFVDISGPDGVPDGQIDSYDKTIIGNYQPKFTFGINSDFSWRRWSMNVLFQGSIGGQLANLNNYKQSSFTTGSNINQSAWDGRWTGEGSSNFYPVVDGSKSGSYYSTRFNSNLIEDSSYLRLKNLTVSYVVPAEKIPFVNQVKVYVTATNLFTITNYSGYDPEISISNSPLSRGVDYGVYPTTRTFSCGVNVGF